MSDKAPIRSMQEILAEAEADAREFAKGCDDLVDAIHSATQSRRVDVSILREAVTRHLARIDRVRRGLHYESSGSSPDLNDRSNPEEKR